MNIESRGGWRGGSGMFATSSRGEAVRLGFAGVPAIGVRCI